MKEGNDLHGYLQGLFTSWPGNITESRTSIESDFRVGAYRSESKYPKDLTVKLSSWDIKSTILGMRKDHSGLTVEGEGIHIFSVF